MLGLVCSQLLALTPFLWLVGKLVWGASLGSSLLRAGDRLVIFFFNQKSVFFWAVSAPVGVEMEMRTGPVLKWSIFILSFFNNFV